jgi:Spy/CpxP family protein refolding chaperone
MKRLLTGFAVTMVATVWMMGSWLFFNCIAGGANGVVTTAAAEVVKSDTQDTAAAKGKCGDHCKCHHWKHHHKGHHFLKELGLSDAQKDQVHAIMAEGRSKTKPLVQKLKEGREQIGVLVKSGQFDEGKVRAIAKGQADIRTDLIVERARVISKIWAVLTPEQRAKAQKRFESWKARHEGEPQHKD